MEDSSSMHKLWSDAAKKSLMSLANQGSFNKTSTYTHLIHVEINSASQAQAGCRVGNSENPVKHVRTACSNSIYSKKYCGRRGVGRAGDSNRGSRGTTVI